jgi:hypothetical protein
MISKNILLNSLNEINNLYVFEKESYIQIKFQDIEYGVIYFLKNQFILCKNNEKIYFDNLENLIDYFSYFNHNTLNLNYII